VSARAWILAAIFSTAAFAAFTSGVRAQLAGEPSPTNPKNIYDEAAKTPGQEERLPEKNSQGRQQQRREIFEEQQAQLEAAEAQTEQQRAAARGRAAQAHNAHLGYLQTGNAESLPRLYETDRVSAVGSLNATIAPFVMSNNAFDAPRGSINAGLPANPGWGEMYVQPGFTVAYHVAHRTYLFGGFSYLESATFGGDYAGNPHAWYGQPEELFGGLEVSHLFGGNGRIIASFGQQEYLNGDGMVLSSGAGNGGYRAAAYLGPRVTWREAALLKVFDGDWSTQFFYLRPNEARDAFDNTRLSGVNVVWDPPSQLRLGMQYIYAASNLPERNQLSTYELRGRFHPFKTDPRFWLQADYATQGKPGVSTHGWMLQANYNFNTMWWKPYVNIGYYSLSPGFDPLYFGGTVAAWLPGFALQTVLSNTNLRYFDSSLFFEPRPHDWLQLSYLTAAVSRLDAPLSLPPSQGAGLPSFGYGEELGATYTHRITPAWNVSPFYAYVWPGNGIAQNYKAHGAGARNWSFLGVAFTATY
jgi:hypothetical protein